MKFFKNKHIVTAAIVAPILALTSYFALDFLLTETPQAAEDGQSYQLVEKPNCRYSSGICGLKNGDFELELGTEWLSNNRLLLKLKSEFPLNGIKAALVHHASDDRRPEDMQAMDDDGLLWSLEIQRPDPERDRLHLVASANQSLYFGDVAMKFTLDEN